MIYARSGRRMALHDSRDQCRDGHDYPGGGFMSPSCLTIICFPHEQSIPTTRLWVATLNVECHITDGGHPAAMRSYPKQSAWHTSVSCTQTNRAA